MVEQWSSELEKSKQTYVALSTAEAEYVTLASASQEVIWMRQLMEHLQIQQIIGIGTIVAVAAMAATPFFSEISKSVTLAHAH